MAEEEEIIITGNKFKAARNEFRKSRAEKEADDNSIEDIKEEEEEPKISLKIPPKRSQSGKPLTEQTESEEEAPAPKRKKKVAKEKVNVFQPVLNLVKDERLHRVIGLALILSSIYLLVAFTSFLFTWKADQDKVMGSWWQLFFPDETVPVVSGTGVDNWLGKLGAVVSHLFIHKGFGVASYFFVAFSFLAGFRVLFKTSLFPLRMFFKRSLFVMLWASVGLGYLFHNDYFFLGGTFGYQTSLWLNKALGFIGTGFLMVFSFFGFMAVSFNYSFDWLRSKESEQEMESLDMMEKNEKIPAENINMEVITLQPATENKMQKPVELPIEESIHEMEIPVAVKKEEEKSVPFEMIAEVEEKKPEVEKTEGVSLNDDENVAFTVAKAKEEAVVEETEDDLTSFGEFDPTLELSEYQKPSIDLLKEYGNNETNVNQEELIANKDRIVSTLKNFGIEIAKIKATIGPTVTLYEIIPAEGVRISKIKNLEDDIALSLAALGIRIIAPMPGKGTIGIEVPNQNPELVSMRSIVASFQHSGIRSLEFT